MLMIAMMLSSHGRDGVLIVAGAGPSDFPEAPENFVLAVSRKALERKSERYSSWKALSKTSEAFPEPTSWSHWERLGGVGLTKDSVLKAVSKRCINENNILKGARSSLDRQKQCSGGCSGTLLEASGTLWNVPGGLQDALGHVRRLPRRSRTTWEASNITPVLFLVPPGDATVGSEVANSTYPGPPKHTIF